MRSKALGYQITDVPGLEEIRVEENEHSFRGVHVVLNDGSGEITAKRSYGLIELAELRDALDHALRLAETLAAQLEGQTP